MSDVIWKQVIDHPEYEISNSGMIRRRINKNHPERNKPYVYIKGEIDKDGHRRVLLGRDKYSVHRLVYKHFCGELVSGLVICHLNNKREDNRAENLLQATQRVNISHKRIHGTWQSAENHPRASISNQIARRIREDIASANRTSSGRLIRGSCVSISKKYNVSVHVVHEIARGRYADA
jgi:hypothetical protein